MKRGDAIDYLGQMSRYFMRESCIPNISECGTYTNGVSDAEAILGSEAVLKMHWVRTW
jgi:hypothetical protein